MALLVLFFRELVLFPAHVRILFHERFQIYTGTCGWAKTIWKWLRVDWVVFVTVKIFTRFYIYTGSCGRSHSASTQWTLTYSAVSYVLTGLTTHKLGESMLVGDGTLKLSPWYVCILEISFVFSSWIWRSGIFIICKPTVPGIRQMLPSTMISLKRRVYKWFVGDLKIYCATRSTTRSEFLVGNERWTYDVAKV